MLAIETQGFTKVFYQRQGISRKRPVVAVDHVDLTVRQGEVFGLVGPNGSGKTTLLKMLATLILPTSGSARIYQFDLSQDHLIRPLIGFLSAEDRSFSPRLSGRQNLELFAALQNLSPGEADLRIQEGLALVGLDGEAETWFQYYSTGMKRRLGIARVLLHNPEILLLDEPAKHLDPLFGTRLMQWLKRELVERQGKTVVVCTHRMEEARALCDRVALMACGRLQSCGAADESVIGDYGAREKNRVFHQA